MQLRQHARTAGRLLAHPGTITVVAFLVRYGIFYALRVHGPFAITDRIPIGYETGQIARSLAEGHGFSSPLRFDTGPTAWMTPLYPMLLAGVFKVFKVYSWESFLVITALDCAFSALTAWVIWAIGRRAFHPACGVTAGWIWALLPSAIFYPVVWVWDTSLSALVFALIVLATMRLAETERPLAWAGYGTLWGAGALVNASLVSTLPFLLGWAAQQIRAQSKRWLKPALVALLLFAVVISPWFVRNYVVFHRLILFRSNFGLELWLGNNPLNPGVWSWWVHPNDDEEEGRLYARLGEMAYMDMKQKEALDWIRQHPGEFVHQTFRRFVDNWTGLQEPVGDLVKRPWYATAATLQEVLFPMLGLLGAVLAYRRRNPYAFPFGASIFSYPLVYYVTHTSLRYRHPIDPVLCVLAGYSALAGCSWLRARIPGVRSRSGAEEREMASAGGQLR